MYSLNSSHANRAHRAEPASMNQTRALTFSDSNPAAEINMPMTPPSYPVYGTDLGRDNLENDRPDADLQDLDF